MPAITSVQECNKLETGVGPSIASGSHRKFKTITDLKVNPKHRVSIADENEFKF